MYIPGKGECSLLTASVSPWSLRHSKQLKSRRCWRFQELEEAIKTFGKWKSKHSREGEKNYQRVEGPSKNFGH